MLLTTHMQIRKSHRSHKLSYVRHPLLQGVQTFQFRQNTSAFRYIPYGFAKYSELAVGKTCKDSFFHAIINLKRIHTTECVSAAHLEFRLYSSWLHRASMKSNLSPTNAHVEFIKTN